MFSKMEIKDEGVVISTSCCGLSSLSFLLMPKQARLLGLDLLDNSLEGQPLWDLA